MAIRGTFYFVEVLSINEWNVDSGKLKAIEIKKDQTQKINTCSKSNSKNTIKGRDMFKVNNDDSKVMKSFCSDVDRVP